MLIHLRMRSLLCAILTLASSMGASSRALAQLMPCEPYYGLQIPLCEFHYGTPVGPGRLTPPEDPNPSRCWYTDCQTTFVETYHSFPLNLSMGFGPGMGDYPPKTLDPVGDTLAVVGLEGSFHARPVPSATRATLGGVIDLMTGVPLLQESDFELSYGSATFRHIRTYSELPSTYQHENTCTLGQWRRVSEHPAPDNVFWDWHGQGWMSSANPILLIDAAYEGVSYPVTTRKCYFIVDAGVGKGVAVGHVGGGHASVGGDAGGVDCSLHVRRAGAADSQAVAVADAGPIWAAAGSDRAFLLRRGAAGSGGGDGPDRTGQRDRSDRDR